MLLRPNLPRSKREFFCRCSGCQNEWSDRDSFLADEQTILNGYQVNYQELKAGWFLFSHILETCHTTFALPVELFADLYTGPAFTEPKTGSEDCPQYCLHPECLKPCPNACACAWVREVMQIIKAKEVTAVKDRELIEK